MADKFQQDRLSRLRARAVDWAGMNLPYVAIMLPCVALFVLFPVYPNFVIGALLAGAGLYAAFWAVLILKTMRDEPEAAIGIIILLAIILVIVTCLAVLAFLFFPALFGH